MASRPDRGLVPSPAHNSSSPQPPVAFRGLSSSSHVQPPDVALKQFLPRSNTIDSNASTTITLVDSKQGGNIQPPPCAPTVAATLSASNPSTPSDIKKSGRRQSQALGPSPSSAVLPLALAAGTDGGNQSNGSSLQDPAPAKPLALFSISTFKLLIKKAPRKTLAKNLMSLAGCICGVVSTFLYTYKSYQISLWQAEQAFYDHCMEWASKPYELGYDVCSVILKEPLRQPPYVQPQITVKHLKRDLSADQATCPLWIWNRDHFSFYVLILLGLLLTAYGTIVLYRYRRRTAMQARQDGHLRHYNALWPLPQISQQPSIVFDPVNVRLAPPCDSVAVEESLVTMHRECTNIPIEGQLLMNTSRKRQLLSSMLVPLYNNTHTASSSRPSPELIEEQPSNLPILPSDDLKGYFMDFPSAKDGRATTDEFLVALAGAKTRQLTQIGDALKGRCDDDRILLPSYSANIFGTLRDKIDSQCRKLPFARLRRQRSTTPTTRDCTWN